MTRSEHEIADKIDVITGQKTDLDGTQSDFCCVQVRVRKTTKEDDAVISKSYHRYVIHSDDDWSTEPPSVQAVCLEAFGD